MNIARNFIITNSLATKNRIVKLKKIYGKNEKGENVKVPKLILSNLEEVRHFYESINRISAKKEYLDEEITFDFESKEALKNLESYNVILKLK